MVTQEDVARECGISVTTVSRVMNKRGYISKETYEKVYAAMRKLNYTPNEIARSLSKNNTDTIGVILPHIDHPYFSKLLNYMEKAAAENGLKLMIFSTNQKESAEEACIEKCRAGRMDGIILCAGNVQDGRFSEIHVPVIAVERNIDSAAASIECDNAEGGRLAARRLAGTGCREVLYIGGPKGMNMPADQRFYGFAEVCKSTGIRCREIPQRPASYEVLDYYDMVEKLLNAYPEVDGIFASSDVIAAQVLQVARRRGLQVPGQLKVVGFDDTSISTLTAPTITTIHQPVKEMAELAVSLLVRARTGESIAKRTIFPVSLIPRESA